MKDDLEETGRSNASTGDHQRPETGQTALPRAQEELLHNGESEIEKWTLQEKSRLRRQHWKDCRAQYEKSMVVPSEIDDSKYVF